MARYVQDPVAIEAFGIFITRTFFFTEKYPLFNRICQLEKKVEIGFWFDNKRKELQLYSFTRYIIKQPVKIHFYGYCFCHWK